VLPKAVHLVNASTEKRDAFSVWRFQTFLKILFREKNILTF